MIFRFTYIFFMYSIYIIDKLAGDKKQYNIHKQYYMNVLYRATQTGLRVANTQQLCTKNTASEYYTAVLPQNKQNVGLPQVEGYI